MTDSNPPLVSQISCHAFNADHSLVALSPNTNEVHIYSTNGNLDKPSTWQRQHILDEHSGAVSGIDWNLKTNQLVSCGHDRNAYVWTYNQQTNTWTPTLVLLRINRAATCVKW